MDYRIRTAVIVTGISCFVLVVSLRADMHDVAAISKVITSCGFLAVAILSGALRSTYGRILLAGLACSFAGDLLLIGESQRFFLLGLSAFLLAHLTYVAAFVSRGVSLRWMALAALPIIGIAVVVMRWLVPHTPPELTMPVFLYTTVISGMVIAAFGTRGSGAPVLILAGALLFFMSDLSVAAQRLVQMEFPTYIWGLPLYYAGQVCLALSIPQSRSH